MWQMIFDVMKECDRLKASSVAFPSIGAGGLGFPPDAVARIMVDAVSNYLDKNKRTSVTSVLFVIFDDNIYKSFQNKVSSPQSTSSVTPSRSQQQTRQQTKVIESGDNVFQCNNVKIKIVQGDITQEACDGLVNTASERLTLNTFGVQGALLRKGGQELQDECKAVYQRDGPLSHNAVGVTGAGRRGGLKCTKVLHVLAPNNAIKLQGTVKSVLDKASALGLKSIALPAIGTGQHGFKPSKAAKHICEAIITYSKRTNTTVNEVRIVLFETELFQEFGKHFQKTGEHSGAWQTITGGFWSAMSFIGNIGRSLPGMYDTTGPDVPDDDPGSYYDDEFEPQPSLRAFQQSTYRLSAFLVISVYASDKETVENVLADIEVVIDENFVSEKVSDKRVNDLSPDEVAELHQAAETMYVELEVDIPLKTITMKGQKAKVADIGGRIKDLFHRVDMVKTEETFAQEKLEKERKEFEDKSLLAASIYRWQWKDQDGTFQDFDPQTSFLIEEAKSNNEGKYTFENDNGLPFEIDFTTNQMMDQTGNATEVKRHDFEEEREEYKKQLAEGT